MLLSYLMCDSNSVKAKIFKKYSAARWKDLTAVQENKPTSLKSRLFKELPTGRLQQKFFQIRVTNHIFCENNFLFQ